MTGSYELNYYRVAVAEQSLHYEVGVRGRTNLPAPTRFAWR